MYNKNFSATDIADTFKLTKKQIYDKLYQLKKTGELK